MKAVLKWAIFSLAGVICLRALSSFCLSQTDGFIVQHIHSSLEYHPEWDASVPPDALLQLQKALDQPYSYLGSGGQCYAFVSADGTFVIKFFKHHLRSTPSWLENFPLPDFLKTKLQRKKNKRLEKLQRDFTSYKLSFEELREETGLLYVHLNKTKHLHQKVEIIDKIGIHHPIDLDQTEFIVQKKADLILPKLSLLAEQKKWEEAQKVLHSLIEVVIHRCEKGIFDEDAKIHRNFGCLGEKVIVIDVGRFRKDPSRISPDVYLQDINHMTLRLRNWMAEYHPELIPLLDEELHEAASAKTL